MQWVASARREGTWRRHHDLRQQHDTCGSLEVKKRANESEKNGDGQIWYHVLVRIWWVWLVGKRDIKLDEGLSFLLKLVKRMNHYNE